VEGDRVKELIERKRPEVLRPLCRRIGGLIGKLHASGIIHGDLTTSNMIVSPDDRVFFVDFGLGKRSEELEDRGVDLHLLRRAFHSTHYDRAEKCFKWIMEGYAEEIGEKSRIEVEERMRAIAERGRYTGGEPFTIQA